MQEVQNFPKQLRVETCSYFRMYVIISETRERTKLQWNDLVISSTQKKRFAHKFVKVGRKRASSATICFAERIRRY